jgi:hypothetical protein
MFGRARILLTITASVAAMPVLAQAPVPTTTAFDGTYAGVSFETSSYMQGISAARWCGPTSGVPGPLTITNGVVRAQMGGRWEGSVNPKGVLVMRSPSSSRLDGQIDSQGTIRGQLSGWGCVVTFVWRKPSGSTTAFDGEYVGVSRVSSTTAGALGAKCLPDGVPLPLTIWNGVVRSDKGGWQGAVSPQGVLGMHRGATRVDGQIDSQGVIRGQDTSDVGCSSVWVWRKQSG